MKKVGKTTTPFRYDLSQIPYDYIVDMVNKFKGLGLVDRVPKELWTEFIILYRGQDQNHPKEKEIQEAKVIV